MLFPNCECKFTAEFPTMQEKGRVFFEKVVLRPLFRKWRLQGAGIRGEIVGASALCGAFEGVLRFRWYFGGDMWYFMYSWTKRLHI